MIDRGSRYYDFHDWYHDTKDNRWEEHFLDCGATIVRELAMKSAYFDVSIGCWIPSHASDDQTDSKHLNYLIENRNEKQRLEIYKTIAKRQKNNKDIIESYFPDEWNKQERGFIVRIKREIFGTFNIKNNKFDSIDGVPSTVGLVEWEYKNNIRTRRMIIRHENSNISPFHTWPIHNTRGPAVIESSFVSKNNERFELKERRLTYALHGQVISTVEDDDIHSKGRLVFSEEEAAEFMLKHS